MKHIRLALIAAAAAGCSAPSPQPAAPPAPVKPIAAGFRFYSQPYAMQEPDPDLKAPQFCHLNQDCMELDSRPFTPCLVSNEPCQGEGVYMQAAPTVIFKSIKPSDLEPLSDLPPKN